MRLQSFFPKTRFIDLATWGTVGLMALLFGFRHLFDADIFYHIANGREILAGGVPRTNTLVWASSERPFYPNPAWLFGVAMALVERSAGLAGIVLAQTALIVTLFAIFYHLCRREGAGPLPAMVLLLLFGFGSAFRFSVRPHLFSFLFFATCLYLLADPKRQAIRRLWVLPPLFLLWANLHSGFILGLILLAAVIWGEILNADRSARKPLVARLAMVFVLSFLATFVVPRPLTNLLFLVQLLEPRIYPITEYLSPSAGDHPWFYVAALLFAALTLGCRARPREWSMLLPGIVFLLLAFYSSRFIPFFLLAALPWTLHSLKEWSWQPERSLARRTGLIRKGGYLFLLAVFPVSIYQWPPVPVSLGIGIDPSVAPLGAVRFLDAVRVNGRLYNSQSLGGPGAMFLAPHYRMYQTPFFQVEKDRIEEAYRAAAAPRDWQNFLARNAIEAVWLDTTREPFSIEYYPAEDWALVYYDDFSAVFLRRHGLNQSVIAAHEYRVANPPLLARLSVAETWEDPFVVSTGIQEARRALVYNENNRIARLLLAFFLARQPGEEAAALAVLDDLETPGATAADVFFEKGRLFSRLGRFSDAEEAFSRYIALVPDDPEGYFELGRTLVLAGEAARARQVLEEMSEKFPDQGHGFLLLGKLLLEAGESNAAWSALDRARDLLPGNAEVENLGGIAKAQQGDLAGALPFFERALELDPDHEAARLNLRRALAEMGARP